MAAKVMKKAWEIFKKVGVRTMEAWSAALRKAWAIAKGMDMVELKGTEKQVAWANDIRKNVFDMYQEIKTFVRAYGDFRPERHEKTLELIEQELAAKDSAEFWIDYFKAATHFREKEDYRAGMVIDSIYYLFKERERVHVTRKEEGWKSKPFDLIKRSSFEFKKRVMHKELEL